MDLSKSYDFFKPETDKSRIHIIGCGSVGATVAENIARCGVKNFHLWDFDKVEPHNIANQPFRHKDIGKEKVEALKEMICEINPDAADSVVLHNKGWDGQNLTGYVFLCADSMNVRRNVVEQHMMSTNIRAMFDFRTRLTDAQHYAADWADLRMKENFYKTMDFSDEEAEAATPTSACGVSLSVCPTIRIISAYGVANFMNFWRGEPIKKMIVADAFAFDTMAF